MNKHWAYLRYLRRHRHYVLQACRQLDIPWRGLKHDLSKLRPDEWFAYADYFYGGHPRIRHPNVKLRFDYAWARHQHRNDHHWQFFIEFEDTGGTRVLPMPLEAMKEMLADWYGAGMALGATDGWVDALRWYRERGDSMILHADTRHWVDRNILYLATKEAQ